MKANLPKSDIVAATSVLVHGVAVSARLVAHDALAVSLESSLNREFEKS